MMTEALDCLGRDNDRGKQVVTRIDGAKETLEVVPHFNAGISVPVSVTACREAAARLLAVHAAVHDRVSAY
jgi:hypothetical protein